MKYFTKEVQIALVAVVSVVVLFFGLQFLKGMELFSDEDIYYVSFDDISGLTASSGVYAAGYRVGVVKDITYDYGRQGGIVAVVGLDKRMRLPEGTTAEIESDMLGNVKVNLVIADGGGKMMAIGDTIHGDKASGMLGKAADMIPAIEKVLPKLDSIMEQINLLLADPALANSLRNVDKITSNLTTTTAELNTFMTNINHKMPGMMDKADCILDNTDKLARSFSEVDVAATMARVDATLENVRQMTDKLNSDDGSLGLLMRDPSLYNSLNATMQSADSLLIDLRRHPKRYVHFSLFGKKDKQ